MECCVIGCENGTPTGGMGYYTFPADAVRQMHWLKAIGRSGWKPADASAVCSAHFAKDCYEFTPTGLRLKEDAVPSIVDHSAMVSTLVGSEFTEKNLNKDIPKIEKPKQKVLILSTATIKIPKKAAGVPFGGQENVVYLKSGRRKMQRQSSISLKDIIDEFNSIPSVEKDHLYLLASKPDKLDHYLQTLKDDGYNIKLKMNIKNEFDENTFESDLSFYSDDENSVPDEENIRNREQAADILNQPDTKQAIHEALMSAMTDTSASDHYVIVRGADGAEPTELEACEIAKKDEEDAADGNDADRVPKNIRKTRNRPLATEFRTVGANIEIRMLSRWEQIQRIKDGLKSEAFLKNEHKCYYCGVSFNLSFHYDQHMMKHDKNRGKYECDICNAYYTTRKSLLQHQLLNHKLHFTCKLCGFETTMRPKAREHCCLMGTLVTCDVCGVSLRNLKMLYSHRQRKHPSDDFACNVCGTKFNNQRGLCVHRNICMNKVVDCPLCPRKFRNIHELRLHKRTGIHRKQRRRAMQMIGETTRRCDECEIELPTRQSYLIHMTTKHRTEDDKNFHCADCDIYFKTKATYDVHLTQSIKHTDPEKFVFRCDQCPKAFARKQSLITHFARHTQEDKYECTVCHKKFRYQSTFWRHQRYAHSGGMPRNHICSYCRQRFESNAKLLVHIRAHTAEKPFICEKCGKGFYSNTLLKEHVNGVHLKIRAKRNRKKKVKDNLMDAQHEKSAISDVENIQREDIRRFII